MPPVNLLENFSNARPNASRTEAADRTGAGDVGHLLLASADETYAPRVTNSRRKQPIQETDGPPADNPAAASLNKVGTVAGAESQTTAKRGISAAAESDTLPPIDRFESQIQSLESLPRPEDGSAVFVGSSTFARWNELEKDFKSFEAHDLAFGGSTIPEINHYFDRLFAVYTPKDVVFYAGTNDIGELHHNGAQVAADFETFEKKFHEKFPDSNLIFVSISAAPSRLDRKADYDEANMLIKDYMQKRRHCLYVDVTHVMGDGHGHPVNGNLFLPDRLHMKERGYQLWEPIIRDALEHPDPTK